MLSFFQDTDAMKAGTSGINNGGEPNYKFSNELDCVAIGSTDDDNVTCKTNQFIMAPVTGMIDPMTTVIIDQTRLHYKASGDIILLGTIR